MRPLPHPPLVLVVEDSDEDFDMVRRAMSEALHSHPSGTGQIVRAEDGDACLRALSQPEHPRQPDLLLLDLNLPGISGLDVLEEIRENESLATLPVVVFSSSQSPSDVRACFERGANAFHVKPLRVPDFRKAIRDVAGYWFGACVLTSAFATSGR